MAQRPTDLEKPMFRHLDVQPAEHGGQRGLSLSDPLGISKDTIFIPAALLPMLGLFDGRRSLAEIEAEVQVSGEIELPANFLRGLVEQLDQQLMLDSPRFQQAVELRTREFTSLKVRPSSHAGSAGYPLTSEACKRALAAVIPASEHTLPCPRGLIAPHIDLARGRQAYAEAYGRLARSEPAELFIILGTGHQGPSAAITGLEMDWQTPLGTIRTDRAFVRSVHDILGDSSAMDVFLHKREHSLEFQVLFLQHILAGRPAEVACFITGSLPPGATERQLLLSTLRDVAAASDKRVCYIAGSDLAHLGPMFGDEQAVDSARLERLDREERQRLAFLESGRPVEFLASVEANDNPDRICGGVPNYLVAELAGGRGELLHYGQAAQEDGSQVVSFCGMVFG